MIVGQLYKGMAYITSANDGDMYKFQHLKWEGGTKYTMTPEDIVAPTGTLPIEKRYNFVHANGPFPSGRQMQWEDGLDYHFDSAASKEWLRDKNYTLGVAIQFARDYYRYAHDAKNDKGFLFGKIETGVIDLVLSANSMYVGWGISQVRKAGPGLNGREAGSDWDFWGEHDMQIVTRVSIADGVMISRCLTPLPSSICTVNKPEGRKPDKCTLYASDSAVAPQCHEFMLNNVTKGEQDIMVGKLCSENPDLLECICMTRVDNPLYVKAKQGVLESAPDQCWYYPCRAGAEGAGKNAIWVESVLADHIGDSCNIQFCGNIYNVDDASRNEIEFNSANVICNDSGDSGNIPTTTNDDVLNTEGTFFDRLQKAGSDFKGVDMDKIEENKTIIIVAVLFVLFLIVGGVLMFSQEKKKGTKRKRSKPKKLTKK
jgi:hypothetical protein